MTKLMNYKLMISVLSLLAAASALSAYADGASDPYQVLENGFNGAQHAQISDIPSMVDIASANPSMKCDQAYEAQAGQPSSLAQVLIGVVTITTPGIPSNGPLFPGTPDTTATVIPAAFNYDDSSFLGEDNAGISSEIVSEGYQVSMSTSLSGDLQSVTTQTGSLISGATYTEIWTSTFRKNGALLYVHEADTSSDTSGNSSAGDEYFYCYPASQN